MFHLGKAQILKKVISEQELVTLIKSQTKEGFDILYENYSSSFYGVIVKTITDPVIAEDILQEVFVKIWRNIDKYDADKARLFTWMLRITRNSCIDYMRSPECRNQRGTLGIENETYDMPVRTREVDYGLMSIVARMEPKYREVIDTVFYNSYSHSEAAELLGLPLGTLKSRARTALLILKSSLQLSAHEYNNG